MYILLTSNQILMMSAKIKKFVIIQFELSEWSAGVKFMIHISSKTLYMEVASCFPFSQFNCRWSSIYVIFTSTVIVNRSQMELFGIIIFLKRILPKNWAKKQGFLNLLKTWSLFFFLICSVKLILFPMSLHQSHVCEKSGPKCSRLMRLHIS